MTRLTKSFSLLTVAAVLLVFSLAVNCATPEETSAVEALRKMFADGLYEAVDRQSTEFVKQFQNSEYLPEVWLIQARARTELGRVDDAISILRETAERSGQKRDEFDFWYASALASKGDWKGAADAFGRFIDTHTNSPMRLQATYHQAHAKHRAGDTVGAINLLSVQDGLFQKEAAAHPDDIWVHRGMLLLAELQLAAGKTNEAELVLKQLESRSMQPDLAWQRSYLMARIHAAAQRWPETLACVTNLWTSVTNTVAPELQAAAALIEGETLEKLGHHQTARLAYERALIKNAPASQRRTALQRIVAIGSAPANAPETAKWLESFVAGHPGDELLDLATFSIGELRLTQYRALKQSADPNAPPGGVTLSNLLQQARIQFDLIVTNYPSSQFIGHAYLYRGICLWEEGTNRVVDMSTSFRKAVETLSDPSLKTMATFKLADSQVLAGDLPAARSNYWVVATNQVAVPGWTNSLAAQALFQVVRTSIDMNDIAAATAAMQKLVEQYPADNLTSSAVLLLGHAHSRLGNSQTARSVFETFTNTFTNSVLLPEVRLEIAKTYEQQNLINEAISALKGWFGTYGGQTNLPAPLLARASFDLARLSYRAKPDTNAVNMLADFCAKFPDHPSVALAQYLIGEYYFSQGDYGKAELQFQHRAILQNTNPAMREIAYRARIMAGRAAVARQSYRSAREHFDWVITNGPLYVATSPIPISIVAEAYLFRGDTFTLEPAGGETNNLARFGEAINAFSKITDNWPTNELTYVAWGRIGECHLQLATQDPKRYEMAAEAFNKVIQSPASIAVRSQAEFELGLVREKQAALLPEGERQPVLNQAMDHYLRILYGRNLRAGENPDPYWVKRAGVAAVELAESQNKPDVAIGVCRRLLTEMPALRTRLEKKIEELAKTTSAGVETNRTSNQRGAAATK